MAVKVGGERDKDEEYVESEDAMRGDTGKF